MYAHMHAKQCYSEIGYLLIKVIIHNEQYSRWVLKRGMRGHDDVERPPDSRHACWPQLRHSPLLLWKAPDLLRLTFSIINQG